MGISQEAELFYQDLNAYLMERFEYSEPPGARNPLNNTYMAQTDELELYLRYKFCKELFPPGTIIIARIYHKEQRAGHFKALIKFIIDVAEKYGIDNIAVEQTNNNSATVVKKFGFTALDKVEKNWINSIEKLSNLYTNDKISIKTKAIN